jgi:hypothetical protein
MAMKLRACARNRSAAVRIVMSDQAMGGR